MESGKDGGFQAFLSVWPTVAICLPCRRSWVRIPSAAYKNACKSPSFRPFQSAGASVSSGTESAPGRGERVDDELRMSTFPGDVLRAAPTTVCVACRRSWVCVTIRDPLLRSTPQVVAEATSFSRGYSPTLLRTTIAPGRTDSGAEVVSGSKRRSGRTFIFDTRYERCEQAPAATPAVVLETNQSETLVDAAYPPLTGHFIGRVLRDA